MSGRSSTYTPADILFNEVERQRAVERSGVLRRGGDPELQRIVERAARYFAAPIAALSIIDRDRQWFAGKIGLQVSETPRAVSFCAHAILRPGEMLVVPDARADRRFAANPLVASAPHLRFYAGMPLVDLSGFTLGALCIIDTKPRCAPMDLFELTLLAGEAERLIVR